jgi:hypothetical protein
MKGKRAISLLWRVGGTGLLVVGGLLYFQFSLQALFAAPSQAILVLLGAVAFGAATVRFIRHRAAGH